MYGACGLAECWFIRAGLWSLIQVPWQAIRDRAAICSTGFRYQGGRFPFGLHDMRLRLYLILISA